MARTRLFTSESVCVGHPDKVADQVSDAVLDAMIVEDKNSRVAVETLVKTGMAVVAGEVTCGGYVDIPKVVRETIRDIGYTDATMGFDYETCAVLVAIEGQSPDIARGVDEGRNHEQGAGDQGLMFGYATRETPQLMPMPIQLAHSICKRLAEERVSGRIPWLRPDGKSQVTVEYDGDRAVRVDTIVVSAHHKPEIKQADIRETIVEEVVKKVVPQELLDDGTTYHVNPTGRFSIGGPQGDSGLTGRKIIVDTYGGVGSHGGGCFSGKDPTKVDRSATYMARHIAKNIVAAELARKCEVQLAYAIGVADPVSILVDSQGTTEVDEEKIEKAVREVFPLRPRPMIEYLDLLRPIFKKTAALGHFGRDDPDFTWEKTDKADDLRRACGL